MKDWHVTVGILVCFGVALIGAADLGNTYGFWRATRACTADHDAIQGARLDRERRQVAEAGLGFCLAEAADLRERLQMSVAVGDATWETCTEIWGAEK